MEDVDSLTGEVVVNIDSLELWNGGRLLVCTMPEFLVVVDRTELRDRDVRKTLELLFIVDETFVEFSLKIDVVVVFVAVVLLKADVVGTGAAVAAQDYHHYRQSCCRLKLCPLSHTFDPISEAQQ